MRFRGRYPWTRPGVASPVSRKNLMSDYSQTIAFKLSSDLRRLLDEAADQEMTNVSAYIRQAVAAKLKRDGWKLGKEAR